MRTFKIVSDSSSDILTFENTRHAHIDYACAPMKLITAAREFTDDAALNVDEMVDFLFHYKGRSQSSCPNTADWLAAFGDADDILCTAITSGLSGSYNSACLAKKAYEEQNPGRRVFVVDTLSAGPEISLMIRRAADNYASGMDYEDICADIMAYKEKTGLTFMLKSLKNFANNGRVSPLVAKLVGIAGICIVGRASDEGTLDPGHKCRGESRALDTIVNELSARGLKGGRVSIGHCRNEAGARELASRIAAQFPETDIEIHPFRGLCSFYAEPGGVLVGFEKM